MKELAVTMDGRRGYAVCTRGVPPHRSGTDRRKDVLFKMNGWKKKERDRETIDSDRRSCKGAAPWTNIKLTDKKGKCLARERERERYYIHVDIYIYRERERPEIF